jgi:hypothetical protein
MLSASLESSAHVRGARVSVRVRTVFIYSNIMITFYKR